MLKRFVTVIFLIIPFYAQAFWPFFYQFGEERRLLGPLVTISKDKETEELIIRPLLLIYERRDGGVLRFPYPIGKFGPEKSYLVPLYMSQTDPKRKNYSFFLFFYGKDEDETYGGFFPFYGELKNRFGKDRIGFFLWPLYGVSEVGGRKKENFFWPIFSIYSGEERGYKFFPFYGRREIEGVRKSEFFFWPFIYIEKKGLDTEDPYSSFFFMPFYLSGKKESGSLESYCVMFPLYCQFKNPERVRTSFLWPFVTKSEGKEKGISVFPFFKHVTTEEYKTEGVLWPFFYTKRESLDEKEVDMSFLILSRYQKKNDDVFFNLWPFFGYETKKETSSLSVPFIFPFRLEGFQKIINPLFSVVEYKKSDNWEGLNILYGLYTQERRGADWKKRLAFLFEVKRENDKIGFKFFSGLLGIEGSKITVFFVPFNTGQKDNQTDP